MKGRAIEISDPKTIEQFKKIINSNIMLNKLLIYVFIIDIYNILIYYHIKEKYFGRVKLPLMN